MLSLHAENEELLNEEHVAKAFEEPERQKPLELLNQYVFILAKLGVPFQSPY